MEDGAPGREGCGRVAGVTKQPSQIRAGLRFAFFAFSFLGIGIVMGAVLLLLNLRNLPSLLNRYEVTDSDLARVREAFHDGDLKQNDSIQELSDHFGGLRKADVTHLSHESNLEFIRDSQGRAMKFRMYQNRGSTLHVYTTEGRVHSVLMVWDSTSEWLCLDSDQLKKFADTVSRESKQSRD